MGWWFRRGAETDRPAAGATHGHPTQWGCGESAHSTRSAAVSRRGSVH